MSWGGGVIVPPTVAQERSILPSALHAYSIAWCFYWSGIWSYFSAHAEGCWGTWGLVGWEKSDSTTNPTVVKCWHIRWGQTHTEGQDNHNRGNTIITLHLIWNFKCWIYECIYLQSFWSVIYRKTRGEKSGGKEGGALRWWGGAGGGAGVGGAGQSHLFPQSQIPFKP